MHWITCNCLNVRIFTKADVKSSSFCTIDPTPDHEFFLSGNVYEVALHIQGIQIEHNYLMERMNCGGWMIHKCVNCQMLTHAKHLDTDRTIVRSNLLMEKTEIDALMTSPNYSTLYKIVIKKPTTSTLSVTISNNIRNVLQSIQSNFEKFINKEEVDLANRIKKFEEDEREKFDATKSKLMQEKNLLLSIIISNDSNKCQEAADKKEKVSSPLVETSPKQISIVDTPRSPVACEVKSPCVDPPKLVLPPGQPDVDEIDSAPIQLEGHNTAAAQKPFLAFTREYSPIVSPLTFGVSNVIPEEDEDDNFDDDDNAGNESDDENDSECEIQLSGIGDTKEIPGTVGSTLKRSELKLPLKIDVKPKSPVDRLRKRDAEDRISLGSIEPEEVILLSIDSDDQRGDVNANFTSDDDEGLHGRAAASYSEKEEDVQTPSALYSTSVPIRVPISARQSSRDVEILEEVPPDAESMAASIMALAKSCHGDTSEIFGELPRPRVKTPGIQKQTSLRNGSEGPRLTHELF